MNKKIVTFLESINDGEFYSQGLLFQKSITKKDAISMIMPTFEKMGFHVFIGTFLKNYGPNQEDCITFLLQKKGFSPIYYPSEKIISFTYSPDAKDTIESKDVTDTKMIKTIISYFFNQSFEKLINYTVEFQKPIDDINLFDQTVFQLQQFFYDYLYAYHDDNKWIFRIGPYAPLSCYIWSS